MSELKAETIVPQGTAITLQVYPKSETDEAIEELKTENLKLKAKNIELQSFYDLHGNVDNYIDKLEQKLHDAEMRADLAEAAATERKIDYDNLKKDLEYHARQLYFKHNRQTLRALWLARAERAKEFKYKIKFAICSMNTKYDYSDADKWDKVERLCRAKADTFKEDV